MITQHTGEPSKVAEQINIHRRDKPLTIFSIGVKRFIVIKPDKIIEITNIGSATLFDWIRYSKF